jgi:hypothetical protein
MGLFEVFKVPSFNLGSANIKDIDPLMMKIVNINGTFLILQGLLVGFVPPWTTEYISVFYESAKTHFATKTK